MFRRPPDRWTSDLCERAEHARLRADDTKLIRKAECLQSIELMAVGVGIVTGAMAGWLWSTTSARLGDDGFWSRLNETSKLLWSDDTEDQFLQQYLRLLPALAKYVAKKLVILALAFAPVAIAFITLAPYATQAWYKRATHIEVTPAQQLTINISGRELRVDETNNAIPDSVDLNAPATLSLEVGEFRCHTLMQKRAYSPHRIHAFTLSMLGFAGLDPVRLDRTARTPSILVQLSSGDNNILWPYLSDWEFDYWIAVSLASVGGMLVLRSRKC